MTKLVLFALLGLAIVSLSVGTEQEKELSKEQNDLSLSITKQQEMELTEPEALGKKKKKTKKNSKKTKKGKRKGNKKGKGKRRGKRKGKKMEKGQKKGKQNKKRKQKKKGKQNKKGKQKKKGKQNKQKRKRKTKGKAKHRGIARSTCGTCAKNITSYLFFTSTTAEYFIRQLKRAEKQQRVTKNKGDKKGNFSTILSNLISSGGGNKSAPKCSGSTTNSLAKILKALIKNVSACSNNINMKCKTSIPKSPNKTEISKCKKAYDEWTNLTKQMNKEAAAKLCEKSQSATTKKKYDALKGCIENKMSNNMTVKQWSTKVTKAKTSCTDAFKVCRTAERNAGPAMQTCSQTSATLVAKLKTLTANKVSANNAISKANSLVGSSGRAMKHARGARAVPTNCNGVLTLYKLINTLLGESLTANITTQSANMKAYTGVAKSCSSLKSSFDNITTSMTLVVASLTEEIKTVQVQVFALTGSTASSTVIAAGGNTTSNSSNGRRQQKQWRLHREILEDKQKTINNN